MSMHMNMNKIQSFSRRSVLLLLLSLSYYNVDALVSPDLALHLPQQLAAFSNHMIQPTQFSSFTNDLQQLLEHSAVSSSIFLASTASDTASSNMSPLEIAWTIYRQELRNDPLKTKVLTGVFLAVVGDALAQARDPTDYNVDRAVSFAAFDGCYRAVQQITYPPIVQFCSGQWLASLLAAAGMASTTSPDSLHYLAALEQTLVSQLVIIPTIYYPVFYAVTGTVQGLTFDETVIRAKETFVPLMKRNLLFWIPIQFGAFAFVEENLQIPILIVCGLAWTIILSVFAGAAKTADDQEEVTASVILETGREGND